MNNNRPEAKMDTEQLAAMNALWFIISQKSMMREPEASTSNPVCE